MQEATTAHACQPYWGSVERLLPSGATHPANAAIVLDGIGLQESWLEATVDDVPVAIEVDENLSRWGDPDAGYHTMAIRLDPAPAPGSHVVVQGDPCYWGAIDDSCNLVVDYVATEDDVTPPMDALEWWWELDYWGPVADYYTDSCGRYQMVGTLLAWVRPPNTLDEGLMFELSGTPKSRGADPFREVRLVGDVERSEWMAVYADQVTESDGLEVCLTLKLLDAAGNTSGVDERCVPCRHELDYIGGEQLYCYPDARSCPADLEALSSEQLCDPVESPDAGPGATSGGGAPSTEPSPDAEPSSEPEPLDGVEPDDPATPSDDDAEDDTDAPSVDDDDGSSPDDQSSSDDDAPTDDDSENNGSDDDASSEPETPGAANPDPSLDGGEPVRGGNGRPRNSADASSEPDHQIAQSGVSSEPDAGCNCRTSGERSTPLTAWGIGVVVALGALRRRRG